MGLLSCRQGHSNIEGSRFCSTCGEPLLGTSGSFNVPAPLPSGKRLRDRYVIRQSLGEGGFGRTYLIEDTGRFDERMVLKEFLPSMQGTAALQKSVELFQREAVTLYRLNHTQIPRFWEVFQAESRLFLVEDFIEGKTYEALLTERIRNRTAFSEVEVLHLFRDLLPVLTYLHHEGVIHRDISPDNIILSAKLQLPVLIDMGAAKQTVINATTVATSAPRPTMIGKTGYSPDEQVRLGIVAPYSDLYALAVTAIVLMTGKQPNQLLDRYTLRWNWEESLTVNPIFAQAINRMLAASPDQRFQSAEVALQALAPLLKGSTQTEVSAPNPGIVPGPGLETVVTPTPIPPSAPGPSPVPTSQSAPNYFAAPLTPPDSESAGSGRNALAVPSDIKGWNWSAFMLGPIWGAMNQVWISFLFIPVYLWLYFCASAIPAALYVHGTSEDGIYIVIGGVVLAVPSLLIAMILGIKGDAWAWKSKRWSSIRQFKTYQQKCVVTTWIVVPGLIFLLAAALVSTGF